MPRRAKTPSPSWPATGKCPEGYYTLPIGKARTLRIGSGDPVATIVSWGMMLLESAIAATRHVRRNGGAVDVIDLRTLMPFDEQAIRDSVLLSNRAVVVTEEADLTSFGRHIHSWIAQNFFWQLDNAPVYISAVAAPAAPYDGPEERAFYPTAEHVERALEQLARE